jgi:4,5-DOPA dioxygenase extradiol
MSMKTKKMPVIFIGHGSPMNALADNDFTRSLKNLSRQIETPKAILVVSAHWVTGGTLFQGSAHPKTIHDFGGFPRELYEIQYPAAGEPRFASALEKDHVGKSTEEWGLDHGAWTILRHIYPEANIPVFQMSLDRAIGFKEHYELGQKINFLREQGVLIIGSGNIVHNLRQIEWQENAPAYDWAIDFDHKVKSALETHDHSALINILQDHPTLTKLAHPSYEHYIPLLYTLGASEKKDELTSIFEGIQNASISMRSFILG